MCVEKNRTAGGVPTARGVSVHRLSESNSCIESPRWEILFSGTRGLDTVVCVFFLSPSLPLYILYSKRTARPARCSTWQIVLKRPSLRVADDVCSFKEGGFTNSKPVQRERFYEQQACTCSTHTYTSFFYIYSYGIAYSTQKSGPKRKTNEHKRINAPGTNKVPNDCHPVEKKLRSTKIALGALTPCSFFTFNIAPTNHLLVVYVQINQNLSHACGLKTRNVNFTSTVSSNLAFAPPFTRSRASATGYVGLRAAAAAT